MHESARADASVAGVRVLAMGTAPQAAPPEHQAARWSVAMLAWLRVWALRFDQALADRRAAAVLLGLVAVAYVDQYLDHPARPRPHAAGWWSWQDQSYYRSTAEAMATFSTDPSQYKVSLGYPLLALPFEGVFSEHLFFVPNLVMVMGIAVLFYRLGRLFLPRRDTVLMFLLVVLATKYELVTALVVPWTTIPTHLIAYAMIYLYLSRSPSWHLVLVLTLLDGMAYLCRPGDGAFLAPIVVASVLQLPGSWRRKGVVAGVGVGVVLAFVAFDRIVNMAVFEKALSSYERGALDDFFGFGLVQRAYVLIVDGMPIYRTRGPMLGIRLPYLLLIGPGLLFGVRRLGWKAVAPLTAAVLGMALYLNYNPFRPEPLYKFHLVHYITWLFPLAGLAAYLSVRRAWETTRTRTFVALVGIPLATFLFVRLEEGPGVLATVSGDGRLLPADGAWESDVEYDIALGRRASHRGPWVRAPGSETEGTGIGSAVLLHVARPRPPAELRARHPADIGATLELRRLGWRLAPMPAWLERKIGRKTVARPHIPVRAELGSWEGFETQVGRLDRKRGALRTTGQSGMLAHGGAMTLDRGRYVVEWAGIAAEEGRAVSSVVRSSDKGLLARGLVELAPGENPRLSTLDLRITDEHEDVEFRFYVFDDASLELHRLEVWRYADWKRARGIGP